MRILVVGGGGFVGHHLVKKLSQNKSNKIYVLDAGIEGFNQNNLINQENVFNDIGIESINYQTYQTSLVFKVFKPDLIINLASLSHVDTSINDTNSFIHYNVNKFNELMEHILKYRDSVNPDVKLIHMSTDEVFGSIIDEYSVSEFGYIHKPDLHWSEGELIQPEPSSIYSITKLSQEHICKYYAKAYNLNLVIVRATNIMGTNQDSKKLIPVVINKLKNNLNIPIYGKGRNYRTWLHIDDLIDFYELIINKYMEDDNNYDTYNVSNFINEISNIELVNKIAEIMKVRPQITFVKDRLNHDYRYSLSYLFSEREGWKPKISLEEGLKQLIPFYANK